MYLVGNVTLAVQRLHRYSTMFSRIKLALIILILYHSRITKNSFVIQILLIPDTDYLGGSYQLASKSDVAVVEGVMGPMMD